MWSRAFPRSTVYDPFPAEWGDPTDSQIFTDTLEGIDQADGILLIGCQQLLSHRETTAFFRFAAAQLEPGGRLLVTVPSFTMIVEWLVRRERAWREYPVWLYHLARGLQPGYAGSYPSRWQTIRRLGEQEGLSHVATLSRTIDREYERMIGGHSTRRWYHWLVFQK